MRYRVHLSFRPDGPEDTGDWDVWEPADRTYREWIGLYGSQPQVTIRLTEATADGPRRVLKSWPHHST